MEFDWWTLAFQAVNFLVLVWLLQRFLFKPVKRVLEDRRQHVAEALKRADQAREEAEARGRDHKAAIREMEEKRRELLATIHEENAGERESMLEAAREEIRKLKEEAASALQAERQNAIRNLREQTFAFSAALAQAVLNDMEPGVLQDAVLKKVEGYLASVDPEERKRLQESLSSTAEGIEVVTAQPLSTEARSRWQESLQNAFGGTPDVRFEVDDALLGGAYLRFPHAVLDFSWRSLMEQAERAVSNS